MLLPAVRRPQPRYGDDYVRRRLAHPNVSHLFSYRNVNLRTVKMNGPNDGVFALDTLPLRLN